MGTESSVLVSSSKYLSNPVIRDWASTHLLRRDGADRVTYSDNYVLNRELAAMRDDARFTALCAEARSKDPALDRWLTARHVYDLKPEALEACAPGTVGAIYDAYMKSLGIEMNVGFSFKVKSDYDWFAMRHSQNHDFDHIVTGGPFTLPTEMIPVWAMLANYFVHLPAEIAGAHHMRTMLASTRFMPRAVLHYPASMPMFLECMAHGIRVGLASDPMHLYDYDRVIGLTPEQARKTLGVREVVEVDPRRADEAAALYGEPDPEGRAKKAWIEDTKNGVPHNRRGIRPVATGSSVLISSSKYLNSLRLRDWAGTHFLRKNGRDRTVASDLVELDAALEEVMDAGRIDGLLAAEASGRPEIARWLARRPAGVSPYAWFCTRRATDEAALRRLLGAGDDSLGSVVLDWALLANNFRHLPPPLAGELSVRTMLGAMRILYRSIMHYPQTWLTVVKAVQKGLRVGQASDLLFAMPFDEAAALPLPEARERLGIRDLGPELDTTAASRLFDDN